MHVRTVLVLAVVVGGLLLAVRWQTGREETDLFAPPAALFEGALADRVDRVRVDNLERSIQLLVEVRQGQGWWITDPIDAPAEGALIGVLLEALTTQDATPVTDADPAKLGLDPPRAVVEFDELVDGERRKRRLEMGAVDLDRQHVFVRREGEIVRTLRTFESVLDRPLDEWRTRRIVRGMDPFSVVEVHRRGSVKLLPDREPVPMELDLVNDAGWRATAPWNARVDPAAVALIVQTGATLRADGFVDDAPVGLEFFGLDQPDLELELLTADGRHELLRFAPMNGEQWFALASSDPRVYSVGLDTMVALCTPPEALVERDFARLVRERVGRIELEADGRLMRLDRVGTGWTLTVTEGGEPAAPTEADPARVGDLMSALEHARILALLPELDFEGLPPEAGGPVRVVVEQDERVFGGELGVPHTLPDGGSGVLFRRQGDGLVTLVDPSLIELARSDPGAFENRQLVLVGELDLARIELERGDDHRAYVLNERGRWSRQGTDVEARTLAILVDELLSVRRAEPPEGAAGDSPEALEDPIRVRLVLKAGPVTGYELGAGQGALDRFRGAGGRRAWVRGGVHASLVKLFEAGI